MGGVSSHQTDKVPVLGVRGGVDHEVGDEGGVGVGGGGEPH